MVLRQRSLEGVECLPAAISRRGLLGGAASLVLPAGSAAAGSGKVSQAQARYRNSPNGKARCANCAQFQAPSACKVVDGAVSPNGYCNFFAPRPK